MKIEKLQDLKSQKGYKFNNQFFVAYEGNPNFDSSNEDYKDCIEYIKNGGIVLPEFTPQEELERAKAKKINELNEFHSSPAVKQLTIKAGKLEAHIGLDSDSRYLLDEQIALLKFRIDLKEVNPTWTYQNGVSVPLNLSQLIGLRLFIGSLTDCNYKARREAEKTINNLKTVEDIINFDFKKNYKINQIIPLAI